MNSRRLRAVLLRASLLAVPAVPVAACTCPETSMREQAFASRRDFAAQIDACLADDTRCQALCRAALELDERDTVERCIVTAVDKSGATLDVRYFVPIDCGAGRRPDGLVDPGCTSRSAGAWLAAVATLEAASVTAFARLVRALAHHRAPRRLIAAARRAIADELLHARLVAGLARRFDASPSAPVIAPPEHTADLETLARENAVEGEVGETFGALVASCQARAATDPAVRRVFTRIARDESAHSALAHALAPWFASRLDADARARVASARRGAIERITAGCDDALDDDARAVVGLPAAQPLRAAAVHAFARLG